MKSKLFMILVVLVMLITVVGLSGCLGGDDKNATNNTTPENNTTVGNNTTENNTTTEDNTTQPPASGGAVTVVLGEVPAAQLLLFWVKQETPNRTISFEQTTKNTPPIHSVFPRAKQSDS